MAFLHEAKKAFLIPGEAARKIADSGLTEERALGYLMGGCLAHGLATAVRVYWEAPGDESLAGKIAGVLLGALVFAPLLMYFVAAASRLAAKALGGGGSWLEARLALFWSLFATAPLAVAGAVLISVFEGSQAVSKAAGAVTGVAFAMVWLSCLAQLQWSGRGKRACGGKA